ncbi:MAG: hypothetical protein WAM42_11365 [Candidatus Nitrosopolaris sp.]
MGNVTHLYAIYCAIKELVEIGLIKSDDGKKVKLHGVTVGNTLNNDIVIFMPDNAYRTASTSTIAPELAPLTPSFIVKTLSAIRSSGGSDRSF